jgi:hypothetical protein
MKEVAGTVARAGGITAGNPLKETTRKLSVGDLECSTHGLDYCRRGFW